MPKYIIPRWTFFAPSPGVVDYRIVFQDYRNEDEPVGNVREIQLHAARSITHAIWNPDKRIRKGFFDLAQQLQQLHQLQRGSSERNVNLGIQMTDPYLAVLNVIMAPERLWPDAQYRRFLVVFTSGFDGEQTPVPAFVSDFHPFQAET